jgi:hypothetical protein
MSATSACGAEAEAAHVAQVDDEEREDDAVAAS